VSFKQFVMLQTGDTFCWSLTETKTNLHAFPLPPVMVLEDTPKLLEDARKSAALFTVNKNMIHMHWS